MYTAEQMKELWAKVKDVSVVGQLQQVEGDLLTIAAESTDPVERAVLVAKAQSVFNLRQSISLSQQLTLTLGPITTAWRVVAEEARLYDEASAVLAATESEAEDEGVEPYRQAAQEREAGP